MSIITLIPVYKFYEKLNEYEKASITQTYLLLSNSSKVIFIGPEKLKSGYQDNYPKTNFHSFNKRYFKSIDGYNYLLKSISFYKKFYNYTHILIVQTDAWIFGNEGDLLKFLDFDYCGAPSFEYGNLNGYNGGLSLRSVKRSIEALKKFRNYESSSAIIQRHLKSSKIYQVILYKWLSIILDLLIRKRIMWPFNYFYKGNEDLFWSVEVPKAFPEFISHFIYC